MHVWVFLLHEKAFTTSAPVEESISLSLSLSSADSTITTQIEHSLGGKCMTEWESRPMRVLGPSGHPHKAAYNASQKSNKKLSTLVNPGLQLGGRRQRRTYRRRRPTRGRRRMRLTKTRRQVGGRCPKINGYIVPSFPGNQFTGNALTQLSQTSNSQLNGFKSAGTNDHKVWSRPALPQGNIGV